jgi:hypothetical protein
MAEEHLSTNPLNIDGTLLTSVTEQATTITNNRTYSTKFCPLRLFKDFVKRIRIPQIKNRAAKTFVLATRLRRSL